MIELWKLNSMSVFGEFVKVDLCKDLKFYVGEDCHVWFIKIY